MGQPFGSQSRNTSNLGEEPKWFNTFAAMGNHQSRPGGSPVAAARHEDRAACCRLILPGLRPPTLPAKLGNKLPDPWHRLRPAADGINLAELTKDQIDVTQSTLVMLGQMAQPRQRAGSLHCESTPHDRSTSAVPMIRTRALELNEWGIFLTPLLPLSAFALGYCLFDVIGFAYYSYGLQGLVSSKKLVDTNPAISSGILWGAMANVYLITGLGVLIVLISWQRRLVRGLAALPFNVLATCLSILGIAFLLSVDMQDRPMRAIFIITLRSLQRHALLGEGARIWAVQITVSLINALSIVVPAMLCSFLPVLLLRPQQGWNQHVLYERAVDLRRLARAGSIFMVAGVLHMYAWMSWAPDLLNQKKLEILASSVVLYWSCVWTLMLAALYLPVLLMFNNLAKPVMDFESVPFKERGQWLADHGISFEPLNQLPHLITILAPLISAPFTQILGNLPQLLGN